MSTATQTSCCATTRVHNQVVDKDTWMPDSADINTALNLADEGFAPALADVLMLTKAEEYTREESGVMVACTFKIILFCPFPDEAEPEGNTD